MTSMTNSPLISVLVPAYNHARYIEACLESIAAEAYPNIELLVLDDGSVDGTLLLAQEWIKEHLTSFIRTWISTQKNQGICATANRLIEESRGDFLIFVASDDQLALGGIKARMEALRIHPEWLAVMGIATVMNEKGQEVAKNAMTALYRTDLAMLRHPGSLTAELILHWSVPGPVLMLRKEAFDPEKGVGRYDERLSAEDRDFYLRLLAREALGYIDVQVARYRVHGSNFSRSVGAGARISGSLLDSCLKNLPMFTGLPHFFLSKYIAYAKASKAHQERPGAVSWVRLALARIMVEALLQGARLGYRLRWCLWGLGRKR